MNRTLTKTLMMVAALSLAGCDQNTQKVEGPSKEKRFELSEKCYKYGKEYVAEYLRTLDSKERYDEPEYHYSMKLNTCLVHVRIVEMMGELSIHNSRVVDVFANKILVHGNFSRNNGVEKLLEQIFDDAPNYTAAEYFKQKDKYFSE